MYVDTFELFHFMSSPQIVFDPILPVFSNDFLELLPFFLWVLARWQGATSDNSTVRVPEMCYHENVTCHLKIDNCKKKIPSSNNMLISGESASKCAPKANRNG